MTEPVTFETLRDLYNMALADLEKAEDRLRAAERVIEAARMTFHLMTQLQVSDEAPVRYTLGNALRHYDEAVKE